MEPLTRKEKKKPKHEKAAGSYNGPYTGRGMRNIMARQNLTVTPVAESKSKSKPKSKP